MLRYFAHTKPYFVSLHTLHDDKTKYLAPLHTRAKSCDHEIVRAQKKVAKGRPKAPPKSCSVVMDPGVKPYGIGLSIKCYFNKFLFMRALTHEKIEYINGYERSECHGLPVLC